MCTYLYNKSKMARERAVNNYCKDMNRILYKAGVEGHECVYVNNEHVESI